MANFDPLLPFKIGPTNGREARESGLRLKRGLHNSGRSAGSTGTVPLDPNENLPQSLFAAFAADCPLRYTSLNAPKKRDVLGTAMLSMLAGHKRYAHMTSQMRAP